MNVDSGGGPVPLVEAWLASGRRLAVIVGSAVALISLLGESPVRVASLRGAVAWGAVLAATAVGGWILPRTVPAETDAPGADDESGDDAPGAAGATRT